MSTSVKIDRQNVEDLLNITPMQAGILFHYLTNQESGQYFEQLSLNVSGKVDFGIFMRAWNQVVARNEMLRTVFAWEKIDKPVQIVLKRLEPTLRSYDFSDEAKVKAACERDFLQEVTHASKTNVAYTESLADQARGIGESELKLIEMQAQQVQLVEAVREADRREGFDLERGPLFRVTLIKLGSASYEMMISNHHIIYDGWSNGVILQEFFTAYRELAAGREPVWETKTRYKEYLQWLHKQDQRAEEKFWREYLQGFVSKTPLPADCKVEGDLQKVDKLVCQIPHELAISVEELAKQLKVTFGAIFYAIWGLFLQKYNNLDDSVFGTTVSGRPGALPGVEKMVGLFINTIPLRVNASDNPTVGELIRRVNQEMRNRQPFEWTPLVEVKSYSELDVTDSLFDSLVVIENYPLDRSLNDTGILQVNSYVSREMTNFDLTLAVLLTEEIEVQFHYNPDRFLRGTMERMAGHYLNLLGQALNSVNQHSGYLNLLSPAEREQVLWEFNETATDYPTNQLVHQLFEEQARVQPESVAVTLGENQLTYRELNERANGLAEILQTRGVTSDQIVGLVMERSLDFVVGILGIWKAGGVYLPINPEYPRDRIEFMLADSGARVLLTAKHLLSNFTFSGEMIDLTDTSTMARRIDNLPAISTARNLAYVIYTSGSTGKPKGVMIEHRALNNFLFAMQHKFHDGFGVGDRCLSLTNISFDVNVCEVFLPLVFGATLVFFDGEQVFDVQELVDVLVKRQITFTFIPPTLLKDVCAGLKRAGKAQVSLNKLLTGLELIKDYVLEDFVELNENLRIVNGYGPTETTICSTAYVYQSHEPAERNIPIGKPLANTQIYILDRYQQPLPVGVVGEVCIAGDGLARGYLQRPELTAEKFVANPFNPGTLLYKTGDLAKWLPDGNIEFIGRNDFQVKLRGFRIELGEIENALLRHPAVKEVLVIAREDSTGPKYLCAYLVLAEEVTASEWREFLLGSLPEYMVPSYFVRLEKLPLNANGKVDRKALPKPTGRIQTGVSYVAPANPVEEKLTHIWAEILGVEKIGVEDNFFELGGHSLKATQLASRVLKEFERELPIKVIFNTPRIRELARYITGTEASIYDSIAAAESRETYPLSPAQKRLYIVNQLEGNTVSYNMPGMLAITGELDVARLERAFQALITRHESLRTSFGFSAGLPFQKIEKTSTFSLEYVEFSASTQEIGGISSTATNAAAEMATSGKLHAQLAEFIKPFVLEEGSLLRVKVVRFAEQEHLLLFDMHHIISDGVSVGILIDEVTRLYAGEELTPLKIQYKDFAVWQEGMAETFFKKQEEYWLSNLAGQLPLLNILPDYPRPAVRDTEGATLEVNIEPELARGVCELALKHGVTLYMTLLAAYTVLLGKYTGQEDIIVGSPVAGRQHADLERIIGMFVNMLAMRNYPARLKSFSAFLHEVRDNALQAFENQDYPFERLVDTLGLERDLSRNPLFDTVFALQNLETQEITIPGLKFTPIDFQDKAVKFDLSLIATEDQAGIRCQVEYRRKLFSEGTMRRFAQHWLNLLQVIVTEPELRIGAIDLLSSAERRQILEEFNDTRREYPREHTVLDLFSAHVQRQPEKVALVYESQTLTYREMNLQSSRLAAALRGYGIGVGSVVAIMVEPALEMFTGIYGVLQAGALYLPIDPDYPAGRIEYMLQDSQARILLTQKHLAEKVQFDGIRLFLDEADSLLTDGTVFLDDELGDGGPTPDDLAYIIYTSGSTGKPKGVPIEHRSLLNLILWHNEFVGVTAEDSSAKYAGFGFDASVIEIFPTLLVGGTVHILNRDLRLDLLKLNKYLEENRITICFLPTPVAEQFITLENNSLRALSTGGDKLKTYIKRPYKLFNDYGPTENTVISTCELVEIETANIPIGRPIANTQVYVVDAENQLQPIGVPGELCVAGVGLAPGYWNRPDLTQEKFIPNPFQPGQRMYKTGDQARWLPDGRLEYLGRMDNQVKIRGYRIELGEIEQQLLQHSAVSEAVVTVHDGGHDRKFLVAYLVLARAIEWADLRKELGEVLPDYMIPAHFIELESLPLTANGKIDRRALPKPELQVEEDGQQVLPRSALEERVASLWAEVLGIDKVGVHDNFFELGGNSLNAMQIVTLLQKECSSDVTLQDIFKAPTVEALAQLLARRERKSYRDIPVLTEQENYELSYAQMRLWYIYQLNPTSIAYNMPGRISLQENVDPVLVEAVLQKLLDRHESLRTYFTTVAGHPVQRIMRDVQLKLAFDDLTAELQIENGKSSESPALAKIYAEVAETPFDLERGPLIRARLAKVGNERFQLFFCLHHIISDGWSMMNLQREFWLIYQALKAGIEPPLEPLKVQYKDFASWQSALLKDSAELALVKDYWREQLVDGWPELQLPRDMVEKTEDTRSAAYRLLVPEKVQRQLHELARKENTSLFMVLLTGFNAFLARLTGQSEIGLGIPSAGRVHENLRAVIGFFVNTVLLKNTVDFEETFSDFLRRVQVDTLQALEYQIFPLELVFEELDIKYPTIAAFFNMLNLTEHAGRELATPEPYHIEKVQDNKFDLVCYLSEFANGIEILCHYRSAVFMPATVEHIMVRYAKFMEEIAENPAKLIKEYGQVQKKRKLNFN